MKGVEAFQDLVALIVEHLSKVRFLFSIPKPGHERVPFSFIFKKYFRPEPSACPPF